MADQSIKAENYTEFSELNYTHAGQFKRNIDMFLRSGNILYYPTRTIYEFIRDSCIDYVKNHPQYPSKYIWKPKICDVGCGGGFGSYILSQEADFVWGIDIDEDSIKWAKAVFEKHKNGIYYSSQLTFEAIDIRQEPREIMPFDVVVCVEVIEHINDYQKTLNFLKRLCKRDKKGNLIEPPDATMVYISSPNRNFHRMGKEHPKNKRHIREWTPSELYEILCKNFQYVTLMNFKGEPRDLDMQEPVMLFKCEMPL